MEASERKRYYVAAEHIGEAFANDKNPSNAHLNLHDAIEEGKRQLRANPTRKGVAIVMVIRLLKRAETPIVVEDIE